MPEIGLECLFALGNLLPKQRHADGAIRFADRSLARIALAHHPNDVPAPLALDRLSEHVPDAAETEHRLAHRGRNARVVAARVAGCPDDAEIAGELERLGRRPLLR